MRKEDFNQGHVMPAKKTRMASFVESGKETASKKPKSLSPVKKDQPKAKYGKAVNY